MQWNNLANKQKILAILGAFIIVWLFFGFIGLKNFYNSKLENIFAIIASTFFYSFFILLPILLVKYSQSRWIKGISIGILIICITLASLANIAIYTRADRYTHHKQILFFYEHKELAEACDQGNVIQNIDEYKIKTALKEQCLNTIYKENFGTFHYAAIWMSGVFYDFYILPLPLSFLLYIWSWSTITGQVYT